MTFKLKFVANKLGGAVVGNVKKVGTLEVVVQWRDTSVDGSHVDDDFSPAEFRCFVQRNFTVDFIPMAKGQ